MKRILSLLIALCLVLGCMSFAAAQEQTTIRVAWWGSQTRADNTVKAIEDFMAKNPDIKVEYEFAGFGDHFTKLSTQAAAGMLPDVFQMDYMYLVTYSRNGVLADLTPYLGKEIDLTNVPAANISSGNVEGKQTGLPCGINAKALAYRPDVLEAAGLTMPMKPTWSEWVALCEQVYEKTGRTVMGPFYNLQTGLQFLLRNHGLTQYNADGTALGFTDPKELVLLMETVYDGMEKGWWLKNENWTAPDSNSYFLADTWVSWVESNNLGKEETGGNCELELAMIPQLDDATQPNTYFKPSMLWSIAETSEKKEAAARFINYFTNDTACYDFNAMDRGLPISTQIQTYLEPTIDSATKKVVAFLNYLAEDGNSCPIEAPEPNCNGDVVAAYSLMMEELEYGLIKREEIPARAQQWMDEANEIIKRSLDQ